MTVRPVRLNNPGDIRIGQPWQGLCPPDQMTPAQRAETEFCVFISPTFGFRALAMTLLTYYRKYKLKTVYSIISRWAPASENDTKAYVDDVCGDIGATANQPLNVEDFTVLSGLCKSISKHEAGGWFFDPIDLAAGVSMALGTEPTPLTSSGPLVA